MSGEQAPGRTGTVGEPRHTWTMKLLALLLLVAPLAACVSVKPYERELLAQPGMSFDTAKSDADQHMLESREASFGGYGSSGGGCGCN
jgi:hypothetical protein